MLIASLPMYDLPEVADATDAWWAGLARCFADRGVEQVPGSLRRGPAVRELWRSPALLFSQTCGHPYSSTYHDDLQLLMTPCYGAAGSTGPHYVSLVLVREGDPARGLGDLDGERFAVNGLDSWSGWHVLRREIADRNRDATAFLRDVFISGTHRNSIAALQRGQARACAVDAVTHTLLARHAARELDGLRVLIRTGTAPALPYVTHAGFGPELVSRLRAGIHAALADPALACVRETLCIQDAVVLDDGDYRFMAGT